MNKSQFDENFQVIAQPPSTWLCNRSSGLKSTGYSQGCIFIQCASDLESGQVCNSELYIIRKRTRQGFSLDDIDDAMAQSVFEEHGWSIKPTRCPLCIDKGLTGKQPV